MPIRTGIQRRNGPLSVGRCSRSKALTGETAANWLGWPRKSLELIMIPSRSCLTCHRLLILILIAFAFAGCSHSKPKANQPGYELEIPEDVPEHLILFDKLGNPHEGNGRELYAAGHRRGWQRCWEEYERGQLDPRDHNALENLIPVQQYGIWVRGHDDGFKACQRLIAQQQQ